MILKNLVCGISLAALIVVCAGQAIAGANIDEAWKALSRQDYATAEKLSANSLQKVKTKAQAQQQQRKTRGQQPAAAEEEQAIVNESPELHEAGTACYIQAEIHKKRGQKDKARQKYQEIINNYPDAVCWDPRGWYWNVAEVAQDQLDTMDTKYDYGDYRSETLTVKAWNALKENDRSGLELYANKCVKLYEKKARAMRSKVTGMPGPETAAANWALNDVATCYYIKGEKYLAEGNLEKAKEMYNQASELGFAVCWDPRGWYWNVAGVAKDKLATIGTKYEYGDYKSETLTAKAWKALTEKDHKGVDLFTNKCVYLFEKEANKMKAAITAEPAEGKESENWAMNDVATCYYLQGEKLRAENRADEAKAMYDKTKEFKQAMCWNPQGWYFNVCEAAQDRLDTMGTKYDFGDYSSQTLTAKAWQCLADKDYFGLSLYTAKCIKLFKKEALKMEKSFKKNPAMKEGPENWALNDVAACYYLLGRGNEDTKNYKQAKKMYEQCAKLSHAVCLDPQGWYFKVAEVAQDQLDLWGTSYSYGDYRSVTLTTKAWQALNNNDYRGVELYAKKCAYLFAEKARTMQGELSGFAKPSFAPYYWALNDVGACYFILGESFKKQGNTELAKAAYQTAIDQFCYAQCWDPRGWYWRVSVVAQSRLKDIQ